MEVDLSVTNGADVGTRLDHWTKPAGRRQSLLCGLNNRQTFNTLLKEYSGVDSLLECVFVQTVYLMRYCLSHVVNIILFIISFFSHSFKYIA